MKLLSSFKRFLPYIYRYPASLWLGFSCGICGGISATVTTFFIGKSVDVLIGKGEVNYSLLFSFLLPLFFMMVLTSITHYFTLYFANHLSYQSVHDLRSETLNHFDSLPLSFFDTHPQGDLLSRFTNDMDNLSLAISAVFTQLFQGVTTILLSFFFMLYLSPLLTLTVCVMTPFIFLINYKIAKHSTKAFDAQQEILGELSSFAKEGITQQKVILAFEQETTRQQQFEEKNQRLYKKGQKAQFISSLTNPLARLVDHLTFVWIALVAAFLYLYAPQYMTIGILSSFTIYATQFSKPFIELSGLMTQIQNAKIGLKRSFYLLDQAPFQKNPNEKKLHSPKGEIIFSHVYFSYDKKKPLIKDFNLKVNAGQKVAIVGKTGAGKSTLINLLMRFYEVDKGQILLDGKAIQSFTRDSLRQHIGMVLQETWLFDSSILDNLTFGNPHISLKEVKEVCQKVQIDHFIESLPNGYHTTLTKGGQDISNGQRQLLTIARTMLKHAPLLILDEATSSVDTLTETIIQESFQEMMKGKTSFIIAHRLSTIQHADLILAMKDGRIIEQGTHHALLAKKGYYAELYTSQFASFE